MFRRSIIAIAICLLLTGIINAQDTLKVLFVGNSYVYMSDIPALTSRISGGTNTYILTSSSTAGGAGLSNHWNGDGGLKTKQMISNEAFDYVILQERSMGTIQRPEEFHQYVKLFSKYCRKKGAEPMLYQTWARQYAPNTQTQISDTYKKAALDNSVILAPIGDTWWMVREKNPKVNLFLADGSHQSALGAFLVACTMVKVLTGELPEMSYFSQINEDISSTEISIFMDVIMDSTQE